MTPPSWSPWRRPAPRRTSRSPSPWGTSGRRTAGTGRPKGGHGRRRRGGRRRAAACGNGDSSWKPPWREASTQTSLLSGSRYTATRTFAMQVGVLEKGIESLPSASLDLYLVMGRDVGGRGRLRVYIANHCRQGVRCMGDGGIGCSRTSAGLLLVRATRAEQVNLLSQHGVCSTATVVSSAGLSACFQVRQLC